MRIDANVKFSVHDQCTISVNLRLLSLPNQSISKYFISFHFILFHFLFVSYTKYSKSERHASIATWLNVFPR